MTKLTCFYSITVCLTFIQLSSNTLWGSFNHRRLCTVSGTFSSTDIYWFVLSLMHTHHHLTLRKMLLWTDLYKSIKCFSSHEFEPFIPRSWSAGMVGSDGSTPKILPGLDKQHTKPKQEAQCRNHRWVCKRGPKQDTEYHLALKQRGGEERAAVDQWGGSLN